MFLLPTLCPHAWDTLPTSSEFALKFGTLLASATHASDGEFSVSVVEVFVPNAAAFIVAGAVWGRMRFVRKWPKERYHNCG